jgi:hypothetical protein
VLRDVKVAVAFSRKPKNQHCEKAATTADLMGFAPAAKQNLEKGAMSVADLCDAAVELSDNTCANGLLARFGGPPALTGFWRSIGDSVRTGTEPHASGRAARHNDACRYGR